MALSTDQLLERLLAGLDPQETAGAVVYYAEQPVEAGAEVSAPGMSLVAPFAALLGFVDRDPTANWGHSSRYVFVNRDTGEVTSSESRLPPFGPTAQLQWRVAYKADSVPDAAVANSS
jgi:hypothetical protein